MLSDRSNSRNSRNESRTGESDSNSSDEECDEEMGGMTKGGMRGASKGGMTKGGMLSLEDGSVHDDSGAGSRGVSASTRKGISGTRDKTVGKSDVDIRIDKTGKIQSDAEVSRSSWERGRETDVTKGNITTDHETGGIASLTAAVKLEKQKTFSRQGTGLSNKSKGGGDDEKGEKSLRQTHDTSLSEIDVGINENKHACENVSGRGAAGKKGDKGLGTGGKTSLNTSVQTNASAAGKQGSKQKSGKVLTGTTNKNQNVSNKNLDVAAGSSGGKGKSISTPTPTPAGKTQTRERSSSAPRNKCCCLWLFDNDDSDASAIRNGNRRRGRSKEKKKRGMRKDSPSGRGCLGFLSSGSQSRIGSRVGSESRIGSRSRPRSKRGDCHYSRDIDHDEVFSGTDMDDFQNTPMGERKLLLVQNENDLPMSSGERFSDSRNGGYRSDGRNGGYRSDGRNGGYRSDNTRNGDGNRRGGNRSNRNGNRNRGNSDKYAPSYRGSDSSTTNKNARGGGSSSSNRNRRNALNRSKTLDPRALDDSTNKASDGGGGGWLPSMENLGLPDMQNIGTILFLHLRCSFVHKKVILYYYPAY